MVLLKKRLRSSFCAGAGCGSRGGETSLLFLDANTHTPQAIGPAAAKTQQRRAPSTLAAAASRGHGLCCLVLCVLGECVCVWSPRRQEQKVPGRPGAQNTGFVYIGKHVGTSGGIIGDHPKGLPFL